MPIKLIIGLGNPGPEYEDTRHNAGFWLLVQLAQQWHSHWQDDRKFFGHLIRSTRPSGEIRLLKPQTYMNLSGQSVQAVASFYKIQPQEILVIHDELDLPAHELRLKRGGGEGGHNGLRSISKSVSTKDYARLRVGIGRPPGRQDPSDFVLSDFPGRERADLGVTLEQAADAVEQVVTAGFDDAQQRLHTPR